MDEKFDNRTFFNNIVRIFETDPDDPWVIETLDWWNE
jgi:hypothetical protein